MHKYEVIIYWSNEGRHLRCGGARAPGCSAHGDSKAAALQSVEQAIDLWIDTAREFGDSIPAPRGERLMLA